MRWLRRLWASLTAERRYEVQVPEGRRWTTESVVARLQGSDTLGRYASATAVGAMVTVSVRLPFYAYAARRVDIQPRDGGRWLTVVELPSGGIAAFNVLLVGFLLFYEGFGLWLLFTQPPAVNPYVLCILFLAPPFGMAAAMFVMNRYFAWGARPTMAAIKHALIPT